MKKLAYEMTERGYTVRAWYDDGPDSPVEITRGAEMLRTFSYPAYRIWNIAAHFSDIVDGLIEEATPPTVGRAGEDVGADAPQGEADHRGRD